MKKAIVCGATGFIGSKLVKYLTEKNIEVVALGRRNLNDLPDMVKKNIAKAEYLIIDMQNIENLDEMLGEID